MKQTILQFCEPKEKCISHVVQQLVMLRWRLGRGLGNRSFGASVQVDFAKNSTLLSSCAGVNLVASAHARTEVHSARDGGRIRFFFKCLTHDERRLALL